MSTERAVETLFEIDPEFHAMVEVLYGADVDPQTVWDDVYGVSKADSAPDEKKALLRLKRAADLVEGGFGRGGRPDRRLTKVQRESKINKGLPPINMLAQGFREGWKGAERQAVRLVKPKTPEQAKAEAAKQVKQVETAGKVGEVARHPVKAIKARPGRSAAIAGGLAVTHHALKGPKPVSYEDAYYGKNEPEFEAAGEFTKFDDDKRLAFGWASVVKKDGVEVVDRQGDWIHPDDLENAAYKYVLSSRIGGDMHKRNGERPHHVSDLVESFVVTPEKIEKMGLPPETPIGWWVGFKVHDDETWDLVKKRGRTGFSIHGKGKRAMHELEGY